jgi:3-oxoadipate enol-lactonase
MQIQDELKIQKATFAGISMGAAVVLRIALAHPSRITALTLMGSTAEASTPEGDASTQQMRDIWVSTPSPSEDIMDIGIRSWGGDPDVTGPRAKRIKQYWVTRHSGAESVDAILQSVNERDALLPRLHEITVPVLLIHGEKDETWELEGALRIQDAIGKDKAKTYIVKDSGHLVIHMRDSEDVSQAIAKFINQVPLQNS